MAEGVIFIEKLMQNWCLHCQVTVLFRQWNVCLMWHLPFFHGMTSVINSARICFRPILIFKYQ